MTDFVNIATTIFSNTWRFLSNITVPGLGGIHFSALFFGILLIGIAFRIIQRFYQKGESDD